MSLCSTLSRIQPWLIERKVPSQKIKIQSHYYDSISLYWLYMNKCVCVFALTVICFTLAVGYGVCIEWLPVSTNTAESSRASTQLTIGETHVGKHSTGNGPWHWQMAVINSEIYTASLCTQPPIHHLALCHAN